MTQKRVFLTVFKTFLPLLLLVGCGTHEVRYTFTPPEPQVVDLTGLPEKAKIAAVTDRIGNDCAKGDTLFMVVEEKNVRQLYKVSTQTGKATPIGPFSEKDVYMAHWDVLDEKKQESGEECIQSCLMATPCGGTYKYGFNASRNLDCNGTNKVLISYSYAYTEENWGSGIIYSSSKSAATNKFMINGNIVEIKDAQGFDWTFGSKGNIRQSRYYLINENQVIASVPWDKQQTDMFAIDLKEKTSWGADFDLEKSYEYVDFGLTPDKKTCVFFLLHQISDFVKKPVLWLMPANDLFKAVQLLRAE